MTVAEMLAAARKADSGGGADAGGGKEDAKAESGAAAGGGESPAAEKPAGKAPAKPDSGERMSVAEMLAAARAKGGGKPAEKPAAKKEAPAKKEGAAKAAAEKPAKPAATTGGAMSTSSILDAARGGAKRGPVSKEEAAGKARPAPAKADGKQKIAVPPMPEKPAYAKGKADAKSAGQPDRRGFLSVMALMVGTGLGVGFTSLTMTFFVWLLGLARFMFPNVRIELPSKFKVGFPSDMSPGVVNERFKAQYGVWIVNATYNGSQEIYALSTVCTHLGCTPNWLEAEQKFKCPCHGSGFYIDGVNFEGPAPRPLERFAISIAGDGQLEVDKSQIFQQEKGEWANPASFVPA